MISYKKLISAFLFISVTTFGMKAAQAQSVQVEEIPGPGSTDKVMLLKGAAFSADDFWVTKFEQPNLTLAEFDITYRNVLSFSTSPEGLHLAVLYEKEEGVFSVDIINRDGEVAFRKSALDNIEFGDQSLKLYLLNNGRFIIRDNIAGFRGFDPSGRFSFEVFNASASEEGEAVSELAAAGNGDRMYVYNPRIIREGRNESRIQLLYDNDLQGVAWYSQEETIQTAATTSDGKFLYIASENSSGNVTVRKFNDEGEKVAELSAENENVSVKFQPEDDVVIFYADRTAQVYRVDSGERLANAFLRGNVNIVVAHYDEADNVVVTLTGSRNRQTRAIQPSGIHIVDLTARALISTDSVPSQLNYFEYQDPTFVRTGANQYMLCGTKNPLNISINR